MEQELTFEKEEEALQAAKDFFWEIGKQNPNMTWFKGDNVYTVRYHFGKNPISTVTRFRFKNQ